MGPVTATLLLRASPSVAEVLNGDFSLFAVNASSFCLLRLLFKRNCVSVSFIPAQICSGVSPFK